MGYNPKLGQWLERDPEGFAAGDLNIGRFVGDNPTNATDPSGLEVWFEDKGITGDAALQLFFQRLPVTQEQAVVLAALQQDPQFQALWAALRDQKGVSIQLVINPNLGAMGASEPGKLTEINPRRPDHVTNSLEIANTILHEMIHQAAYLRESGINMPIPDNAFDMASDPNLPNTVPIYGNLRKQYLKNVKELSKKTLNYLDTQYGSSPGRQTYDDINRASQEWIAGILNNLLKNPKVIKAGGKPTTEMRNCEEWKRYGNAGGIITYPAKP